jgi:SAM-dependent methyltransferase
MKGPADPGSSPTARFSSRVVDYVRYRPGYPPALLDHLVAIGALHEQAVVADVGSGTGILTRALQERGAQVHAIEPNADMRAASAGVMSSSGRAEATGLPESSVDLICAAQAFHWFAPVAARSEFVRILRPGGWVALIWNTRLTTTPFLQGYEALLQRWGTDYAAVNHRGDTPARVASFFAAPWDHRTFANAQHFDLDGLLGRVRSSSYTPPPGHRDHAPMMSALSDLFAAHVVDGVVTFAYEAELYSSRLC